jgi:hypothetical protein
MSTKDDTTRLLNIQELIVFDLVFGFPRAISLCLVTDQCN